MRIFSWAAGAVFALATAALADTPRLTVATGDYAPFTGQALPDGGSVNARVRQIAEAAGFDVVFEYMPWKRTLEATRRGRYQATSYWMHSPEREPDFIHVGPVMQAREVFFVRTGDDIPDWTTLSDLSGYRIGVVTGYTYSPELWNLGEAGVLNLIEATSDEANLKKLLAGRIDLFPTEETAGWHLVRQVFSEEERARFTTLERPMVTNDGYLLVARATPDAETIAEALQDAADRTGDQTGH